VTDIGDSDGALLDAPLDDEPYTSEEEADDDAALERVRHGHGVPLDELIPNSGQVR
jgi:hypothetical protein